MSARGYNLAVEGHIVPVFPAATISGGIAGQAFSLKNAAKANIIISYGALAAAPGTVTVSACTSAAGANPVAIGFDRYTQVAAGAGNDVLAPRQSVTSAGFTPSDVANTLDVLHIQADQLPSGHDYLLVSIADGTNADFAAVIAVLTGVRYQGESTGSATV